MEITRELVVRNIARFKEQRVRAEAQRDAFAAQAAECAGGIAVLESLLVTMDAPEPEDPTDPPKADGKPEGGDDG